MMGCLRWTPANLPLETTTPREQRPAIEIKIYIEDNEYQFDCERDGVASLSSVRDGKW